MMNQCGIVARASSIISSSAFIRFPSFLSVFSVPLWPTLLPRYSLSVTIRARQVRELSLQILFAFDAMGTDESDTALQIAVDTSSDVTVRTRALEVAGRVWAYRADADAWLERLAPQWPPKRMPAVDRTLLRLGLWELTATETPPKVVIDEAIELAKLYSTENSAPFVNGLLDAAYKEIETLKVAPDVVTPTL